MLHYTFIPCLFLIDATYNIYKNRYLYECNSILYTTATFETQIPKWIQNTSSFYIISVFIDLCVGCILCNVGRVFDGEIMWGYIEEEFDDSHLTFVMTATNRKPSEVRISDVVWTEFVK